MMEILAKTAERFGPNNAIRTSQNRISFQELVTKVRAKSEAILAHGWQPGQRLGFPGQADVATVIRFWSLLNANLVACPYDPRWPRKFVDETLSRLGIIDWLDDAESGHLEAAESFKAPHEIGDKLAQLATICFSSGSTGTPKAIGHRVEAHLASATGSNQNLPLTSRDTWLLSLPIFHVSGLGILFRCLTSGAAVAIPTKQCPLEQAIHQLEPTHLSLVPTQLTRLLKRMPRPPEFLRAVLLGGAPIARDLISSCESNGWPIYTTYGLSETASQITTTEPGATMDDLFTVGRVLAGRKIMIGQENEILVQGDTMFEGYVKSDRLDPSRDLNGWFATGDRGYFDDEQRLVILGRRDNQFISGGENIYPEEIERALLSLPGVHQAVVVDIPNSEYGRRPVAFVDCDAFIPHEWLPSLSQSLPRFKLPDTFLAMPPQSGLKPNRHELRKLAARIQDGTTKDSD